MRLDDKGATYIYFDNARVQHCGLKCGRSILAGAASRQTLAAIEIPI